MHRRSTQLALTKPPSVAKRLEGRRVLRVNVPDFIAGQVRRALAAPGRNRKRVPCPQERSADRPRSSATTPANSPQRADLLSTHLTVYGLMRVRPKAARLAANPTKVLDQPRSTQQHPASNGEQGHAGLSASSPEKHCLFETLKLPTPGPPHFPPSKPFNAFRD